MVPRPLLPLLPLLHPSPLLLQPLLPPQPLLLHPPVTVSIQRPLLPKEAPVARCLAGGTVSGVRQVQDILVVVVDVVAFAAAIGTAVVVAVSIVALVAATVTISPK